MGLRLCPSLLQLHAECSVVCAACNLGFDIGVSSDVGHEVRDVLNLSDLQTEVFMGSINVFAVGGALIASCLSDRIGRRRAFAVAALVFELGVGLMAFASGYPSLMLGRAIVGLGVGFGLAVDPVYIAEISPPEERGRLVTWSEVATNVGILIGFMTGFMFGGLEREIAWRFMLGMGGVLPIVMLLLVWLVMPESPRWLVQKGRLEEARQVLQLVGEADTTAAIGRMQVSSCPARPELAW